MTRVSILITSYNQRDYLRQAIDSALNQTHPAHEIIIVDDASSDGSQDLIADYALRYPDVIRPIYHNTNTGVTQARNDALEVVTGDYVSILDGDDLLHPEKLALENRLLQQYPDTDLIYGNYQIMDKSGNLLELWVKDGKKMPEGNILLPTFARQLSGFSLFRCELVRYDVWREVGFYVQDELYEDYDMRIRLTHRCHALYLPQILSYYRVIQAPTRSKLNHRAHYEGYGIVWERNQSLLSATQKPIVERHIIKTQARFLRDEARAYLALHHRNLQQRWGAIISSWRSLLMLWDSITLRIFLKALVRFFL
jgi:glycosyltransferase involved in cell wall biosynthesis